MALAFDSFNRANETPLALPWTKANSAGANVNLVSNAITSATTGVDTFYYYAGGATTPDQFAQIRVPTAQGTNDDYGPAVRISGNGHTTVAEGYFWDMTTSGGLYQYNNGVINQLVIFGVHSAGDVIRLEATGSNPVVLKGYVNGVLQSTFSDSSAGRIIGAGNGVGFFHFAMTGGDDFSGGDLGYIASLDGQQMFTDLGPGEAFGPQPFYETYDVFSLGFTPWTLGLSDTITLSDALGTTSAYLRNPADTITLSDALSRTAVFSRSLADTTTLSDAMAKAVGAPLSDTITLGDALVKAIGAPLADTITLSDALVKSIGKPQSDTITLSDVFTPFFTPGGGTAWTQNLSDTITMSDAIVKSFGANKSDTITLSDVMSRAWASIRSLSDTITLSDGTAKAVTLSKADTTTLSDAVAKAISVVKGDTVTLADAITKAVGAGRSDTITLNDALGKSLGKFATDTITLSDVMTPSLSGAANHWTLNLADTITLADALTRSLSNTGASPTSTRVVRKWFIDRFGPY